MDALAAMPKYEAYKESGVDWLGSIPESWDLKPGLVAFSENKRNNKGMKEDTVLSLSYGKIIIKPEEKLVGLVPESFETYQLVEPSDIIIRCTDLQNDKVSLRTGLAKDKGIITSAYLNLKVKSGFNSRFLHYYLHALDTTKVIYKFGSGLRQNLSFLDFKRLPIFDIPEETQEAIANFLDQKTAQIDEAISIKEKQIALLKERKQIIIQKAVTQGLNPDVPMKDSGVDWIGKIPEHWEIFPLRRCASVIDGDRGPNYPNGNDFSENGYCLFLNAGNVTSGGWAFENCSFISQRKDMLLRKGRVLPWDIVFTTRGTVGNCLLNDVFDEFPRLRINSGMVLIRKQNPNLSHEYLNLLLNSTPVRNQIGNLTFGSAQPQLTVKDIGVFQGSCRLSC